MLPFSALSVLLDLLCTKSPSMKYLSSLILSGVVAYTPLTLALDQENPVAYIPAQCYTNPVNEITGQVANPCYTCHTDSRRPNYIDDGEIQTLFSFTEAALVNNWKNYFKGFSTRASDISNQAILDYVRENNYFNQAGQNLIAKRILTHLAEYDSNNNGQWDGYIPDIYYQFDNEGFDRTPTHGYTGWRAFAYYPFPGGFMPTNGSTDDVIIRLPVAFQQDTNGKFDLEIYKTNLAIVEALIKEKDIPITATDEKRLEVDLDKDGTLGTAQIIRYDWAPREGGMMSYVGKAKVLLTSGKQHLAAGLYPVGTEFIHSVRYLDIDSQQRVQMAPRMKELRYARKTFWVNYFQHDRIAAKELKERHDFPDRIKQVIGSAEAGVRVPQGWVYQGFIEDQTGALRPQSYEEHVFCTGCHSGIGVITDTTFAFKRKLDSDQFQQGWYHWTQKSFTGVPEPRRESDGEYEYSFYLKHNPTGDEYRSNMEVKDKFFDFYGEPKPEAFAALHEDISELLLPSPARALELNKAYKALVEEQSYVKGRESMLVGEGVIHRQVELDQKTGIETPLQFH